MAIIPILLAEDRLERVTHDVLREQCGGLTHTVDGGVTATDTAIKRTVLQVVVAVFRHITGVITRGYGSCMLVTCGIHVTGVVAVLQPASVAPTDQTAHTVHTVHDTCVVAVTHLRDGCAGHTTHHAAVCTLSRNDAVVKATAHGSSVSICSALRIIGDHIAHNTAHVALTLDVAAVVAVENLRVECLPDQTADMIATHDHPQTIALGKDCTGVDSAVTVAGNCTDVVSTFDKDV